MDKKQLVTGVTQVITVALGVALGIGLYHWAQPKLAKTTPLTATEV